MDTAIPVPPQGITLSITMTETGQVSVSGPIENKILCYGLMEIAKEVIFTHNENMARRVVPASPADRMALIRGNGHG